MITNPKIAFLPEIKNFDIQFKNQADIDKKTTNIVKKNLENEETINEKFDYKKEFRISLKKNSKNSKNLKIDDKFVTEIIDQIKNRTFIPKDSYREMEETANRIQKVSEKYIKLFNENYFDKIINSHEKNQEKSLGREQQSDNIDHILRQPVTQKCNETADSLSKQNEKDNKNFNDEKTDDLKEDLNYVFDTIQIEHKNYMINKILQIFSQFLTHSWKLLNFTFKCLNEISLIGLSLIKEVNILTNLTLNLGGNSKTQPQIVQNNNVIITNYFINLVSESKA